MREYHSPEPIILSVGEEDEVSIADVARAVASKYLSDVVCGVVYWLWVYPILLSSLRSLLHFREIAHLNPVYSYSLLFQQRQ